MADSTEWIDYTPWSEPEGTLAKEGKLPSAVSGSSEPASLLVYILGIISFLLLVALLFSFFGHIENGQCSHNPLIYGAQELSNEKEGNLSCFCSYSNPRTESFYFNQEKISSNP